MLNQIAAQWGIDAGILTLAMFCFFWVLLGLGGAILALSLRWPFSKNSRRAHDEDPGLAQNHHLHTKH